MIFVQNIVIVLCSTHRTLIDFIFYYLACNILFNINVIVNDSQYEIITQLIIISNNNEVEIMNVKPSNIIISSRNIYVDVYLRNQYFVLFFV